MILQMSSDKLLHLPQILDLLNEERENQRKLAIEVKVTNEVTTVFILIKSALIMSQLF